MLPEQLCSSAVRHHPHCANRETEALSGPTSSGSSSPCQSKPCTVWEQRRRSGGVVPPTTHTVTEGGGPYQHPVVSCLVPSCQQHVGVQPESSTISPEQRARPRGPSCLTPPRCCSRGLFQPMNLPVPPRCAAEGNTLPFALASAEVMFSTDLVWLFQEKGPHTDGPGELAPPLCSGSDRLAPS